MKPQILPPNDPANLHDALINIAETAKQNFSADFSYILAINPITKWVIEPDPEHKPQPPDFDYSYLESLVPRTLKNELVFIDQPSIPATAAAVGYSTLCSVIIRTKGTGRPLAVLFLAFYQPRQLDQGEARELLLEFTAHASLVLKTTWLIRRYRKVISLGQEISQELESHEKLFNTLKEQIAGILDISHFLALAVYRPESDTLDFYMSDRGEYKKSPDSSLTGGCAHVIKNKQPVRIKNYDQEAANKLIEFECDQIPETDERIPQSLLYVPLVLRDSAVGALTVQYLTANHYRKQDIHILQMIAVQVALALGNLRLFEYLNDVNLAGQKLTRQLTPSEIGANVVRQIHEVAKADIVVLYLYEQSGGKFIIPPFQHGQLINPVTPKPEVQPDDIAWLALKKGEPIFQKHADKLYAELGGDPAKRRGDFETREKIKSVAALPLQIGNEVVGILFVNFREPQRFDAAQKALISSITNFAAIAIRDARLLDAAIQRRLKDIERLRQIDIEISRSLNLQEVLQKILVKSNEDIKADNAAILLTDARQQWLKVEAAIGFNADQNSGTSISLSRDRGMALWAYRKRRTARSGDVHNDPKWKDLYYDLIRETRSEIDVPLFDGDRVIGVLNYESNRPDAFSLEDEKFIEALARKAEIAVKNAQNFEREKRAVDELSAMQEIVKTLNYEGVLDTILAKALEITGSDGGIILLLDDAEERLHVVKEKGLKKNISLPKGEGITWEAIEKKQSILANANDPIWKDKFREGIPGAYWELAVPVLREEKAIGVINIESGEDHPLTERDKSLLEQLAVLASIALQNAEQFRDLKDRETRLEALRSIDQKILEEEGDPQQVIEEVLQQAQKLTDAEIAGLHLYQESAPRVIYRNERGEQAKLHIWRDDRVYADGIVAHVANTGQPHRTGNAQGGGLYKGPPSIHSELAVPLRSQGQVIGVLNIESPRPNAFDQHHEQILLELSGQASIAINSALSFQEAKEQSTRFKVLTEVGEELSRITEPEQVESAYDTVLKKLDEDGGVEIIVRRLDKLTQEFVLVRLARHSQSPLPERVKIDQGINGMAMREQKTIYIEDRNEYLRQHQGLPDPIFDSAIRTIIAAPIQVEDDYFGNLILSHHTPGHFKSADIKLAEGLAKQLAVTLQRIEALERQRKAEQVASETELFGELGQSAYEVTHRLGNDLGLVRTYANNILNTMKEEGISNPAIEEEVDKVVRDVSRALGLSRAMKERMSDIGKSRQTSEFLPVVVLLENLQRSLPVLSANIDLQWKLEALAGHLQVNTGQITDIVVNLVNNAADAMPEGGKILLHAYQDGGKLYLEVSDNGPGISPKNQQKIFNLFFSTKESSGFGLWSALRYARKNSGDLILKKSVVGEGSTFALTLPLVTRSLT